MDPELSSPDAQALLIHREFLRNLAGALLRDEHAAEDVVQETWVAALRNPPRKTGSLRAWLARVARNRALDEVRRNARRAARESQAPPPSPVPTPEEIAHREAVRRDVVAGVLSLPDPYRSVLILRFYEDLSAEECARRLDRPLETVRTQIRRGLERLRLDLDRRHGGTRIAWAVALAPLASPLEPEPRGDSVPRSSGFLRVAAAACVLGTTVGGAWHIAQPPASPPARISSIWEEGGRVVVTPPLPTGETARTPTARPPDVGEFRLAGRVLDDLGDPVSGATVLLLWNGGPGEDGGTWEVPSLGERFGNWRQVRTESVGRFEARLQDRVRVHASVWSSGSAMLEPCSRDPLEPLEPWQGRWVEVPAEGIDFTVRRNPTATVVVRAAERRTGRRLAEFECSFRSREVKNYQQARAQGEELTLSLPLHEGKPSGFEIYLTHPLVPEGTPPSRVALETPGEIEEVDFLFDPRESLRIEGEVRDPRGEAVEGALVFLGTEDRMRGDELFKPFDEARIRDGVRTDPGGRFVLEGQGNEITAWHPAFSPVTVPAPEARGIRMDSRGTIRGRILGADELPLERAVVTLDQAGEVRTDSGGRFEFDGVCSGWRGLRTEDGRFVAVRVRAAGTEEVEIGRCVAEVEVSVREDGTAFRGARDAVLLRLESPFLLHTPRLRDGRCSVREVLPGPHLLLARSGDLARLEILGPTALAEMGRFRVGRDGACPPELRLPEGVEDLVRRIAGRLSSRRRRGRSAPPAAPAGPGSIPGLPRRRIAGESRARGGWNEPLARAYPSPPALRSVMARVATVKVLVPPPLRACCEGASELSLSAANVRAVLETLERSHPSLHRSICDETGTVRRHVALFVNTAHVRDRQGLDTALAPGDVVSILTAVSGG
ncbi:MAG: sigma-70 family RNA polymerase sigma factor [Planctomycetes bacterium]|nr:sigma-70 family RNA polymerase sigma factor [Planctomycetota bacterium]